MEASKEQAITDIVILLGGKTVHDLVELEGKIESQKEEIYDLQVIKAMEEDLQLLKNTRGLLIDRLKALGIEEKNVMPEDDQGQGVIEL